MPSRFYDALKQHGCEYVSLYASLELSKQDRDELRESLEGRRKNLPYFFAHRYPGKGRDKAVISAHLVSPKRGKYELHLSWFISTREPPDDFGDWQDCQEIIVRALGDEPQTTVNVRFGYDSKDFRSLFLPVEVSEQSKIFDEVIELTGVKKTPEGKTLYELEVSIREGRLRHTVTFNQEVALTEEFPIQAIEAAKRISTLALERVE